MSALPGPSGPAADPPLEPGVMDAGAGSGQRSVSVTGDNYATITTGDHSPVRVTTVGHAAAGR